MIGLAALLAEGDAEAAEVAWHQSADILDRLPHPLADEVRAKLRGPGEMTGAATAVR